ncbi:eIF-2-alpha kinase GCN2 [Eupeodes corollae]|uniref:eIF-2-alpha kinase GCN2 n=1 Tax=Eupeodes corollae TaxID=290404 RepID=UPI0024917425|nr:eIF-2-alpha kinase GCN2 [Eupeodes corollae]
MATTPATKESFRERQISELEVIKSIFGNDVEDLRDKSVAGIWKPPDIRILLTPLRDSSGNGEAYVRTKLRIICPAKYPKLPPKISLEETKGISDSLIDELLKMLHQQSVELRGEVMIFELAQTVQAFLLKHNKPPRGSFYDEMVQEKQKREQEELYQKMQKETLERQNRLDEVERRKEIYKSEARRRGEPRRSMSESNRNPSSSESSENSLPYFRGLVYPNKCLDHRSCETLYFQRVGRQIKRGCCLGHSPKGCIAYTGLDVDNGQLLFITEWNIKYSQLEQRCTGSCFWGVETKCGGHKIDEMCLAIEKQVAQLSQLNHKNLIPYECVLCMKRKEGVQVYLAQDFVLGTSVFNISSSLGWCIDGARMVTRGVIDALVYLHNKGVSHSHLFDTTVFMDNTGTIRCTDFSLVPNLLDLVGGQKSSKGDLPALGALVESLMPTLTFEMRDFIDKCNSDRTLSASELLEHPFLRSAAYHDEKENGIPHKAANCEPRAVVEKNNKRDTLAVPSFNPDRSGFTIPTLITSHSRLKTEFEELKYLGKGAFGDVLKVRNILDNREYAIKRIPLPARSRQLYKKMTREVELLSRLNHENVVRYFNSWIESATDADMEEMDNSVSGDLSVSYESTKPKAASIPDMDESSSSIWKGFMPTIDDSDSDGIEFVNSNGEVAVYEEESSDETVEKCASPRPMAQVMYIQMEFCEKCTLRTAIDDNLYEDTDRLWRLFREIAEGLSHIHQQGMIHRDLKPVNIFLDSHDQIKIGDFGLATTSFLALQAQEHVNHSHVPTTEEGTGTGKVGTTLYVAPELTGNASKSTYGQKVDMYTLGIILFEMSQPPFETGMERAKTILSLRTPAIIIPDSMLKDSKCEKTIQIIRWLLNHDPCQRPTAEELLASDLVPPAQLEANELQEMLRHALANPQSKAYKHLVARCLQQESDEVLEHTYHLGLVSLNPAIEFVKSKVVGLFRKHGAIEVDTPLLSPFSKNSSVWLNPVKLMTHSGGVVVLPSDLRVPFARHIAMSGVNMIRRYSVDRVYREKKVFNFHPKQNYECAFDIITPMPGNHLIDAEIMSVAYEITNEIPRLRDKNICIRMNHTSLLRSILIYCNVPKSMYSELFGNILDYIEGRLSKFHFHSAVTAIMEKSKTSASALIDLLLADFIVNGQRNNADESALKSLVRGKGEASSLAKGAIRELEAIVMLAKSLGVTCPIHVCAGLPISFERASSGGIVWQMIADVKPNRSARPSVLAVGERYDTMLVEFQKQAQSFNANIPNRGICGAGLSFSLDKLVAAVGSEFDEECRAIDVGVCVTGSRPPLKDVTYIMRILWSAGIRSGIVEATGPEEAQDLAKDLGAVHVILVAENGSLRVRSWDRERFQERHVTHAELVEYIQKLLRHDNNSLDYMTQGFSGLSMSASTTSIKNSGTLLSHLPKVQVVFMTHEKMTANSRRRYENHVTQQMTTTLLQFGKNEDFTVLVVDLPSTAINAIVGAINPREVTKKETELELNIVIERFPKHRRYISTIFDEIIDILSEKNNTPIVALYNISDSYYRVII